MQITTVGAAEDVAYKKRLQMGMTWIKQTDKPGEIAVPAVSLKTMDRLSKVSASQANAWGAMQSALEQTGLTYVQFQNLMSGVLNDYLTSKGTESRPDLMAKVTAGFTAEQKANFAAGYGDGGFYFPDLTPGGVKPHGASSAGLDAMSGIAQRIGVQSQLSRKVFSPIAG